MCIFGLHAPEDAVHFPLMGSSKRFKTFGEVEDSRAGESSLVGHLPKTPGTLAGTRSSQSGVNS
jgi:hypothetical protein